MFFKNTEGKMCIALVYVDDLLWSPQAPSMKETRERP